MKALLLDRLLYGSALLLGALAVVWTGSIFVAKDALAFTITAVIGGVYTIGAIELLRFGQATATLCLALNATQDKVDNFDDWLDRLDPSLRNAVRRRVEGQGAGLPAPVLTPYLVGLLVMLGLLGTFVGMVDTLRGAVAALEGTTELLAIRQGLAAPINGLGMAFGTSVAGVATSAMLGLMSTLGRRRRMMETRRLDACIPICFQDFSLTHSQRETFRALQRQTRSLPAVAGMLETVAGKLDQLGNAMVDNQERFHQTVADRYAQLAASMDHSLKENLSANVRLVGESIKPVVETAMHDVAQATQSVHRCLTQVSQDALFAVGQRFDLQTQDLAASWKDIVATQRQANDALIMRMSAGIDAFSEQFDHAAASMLDALNASAEGWIEHQKASDQDRMAIWSASLDSMQRQAAARLTDVSATLTQELEQVADMHRSSFAAAAKDFLSVSASLATTWHEAGEENRERQDELTASLTQAVDALTRRTQETASRMQLEMTRLVESSADLMQSRRSAEDAWIDGHAVRMDALTKALSEQLVALREDEDRRGQAAVSRLEQLESALTSHLSTLGQALEAPMARLIETASTVPRQAASLVEQMHRQTANHIHRDNRLLDDRRRIMEQLEALTAALTESLSGQREAIEQLVVSSKGIMTETGRRFAQRVDEDVSNLSSAVDNFAVSAVEMASLGESFGKAVELFNASNHNLVDNLGRIEEALDRTTARSDDQLGYVVAQAREIIDHSMLSQKEIFDALRRLQPADDIDLEAN